MSDLHYSFSGMIQQVPGQVTHVYTEEQACRVIASAMAAGLPVNFRGSGHSFGDRCTSDHGLLVINKLTGPVSLSRDNVAEVPTGQTWIELERQLNRMGRSAPVLTNWLGATVGGTLAYGGFGVSSFRCGAQADHVTQVRYIGPDGEMCVSRPGDDSWSVALCSAGSLGFVTSVHMTTHAYLPCLEEAWIPCRDEHELGGTLLALARTDLDIEMLWGQLSATQTLIGIGRRSQGAGGELAGLLAAAGIEHAGVQTRPWDAWLDAQSTRQFPRDRAYLWSDYVVPASVFAQFFAAAYESIYRADFSSVSRPRIRVLVVDRNHSPASSHELNPVNFSGEQLLFGIGVYLEPPIHDAAVVTAVKTCLSDLLDLCLALRGRPYFATWHQLGGADAARAYPGQWERAQRLLLQHADRGLINPGTMPPL